MEAKSSTSRGVNDPSVKYGGFEPASGRILIRPAEEERSTPTGLIKPQTAGEIPLWGEILCLNLSFSSPEDVMRPGDVVVYDRHVGTEIVIEGETLILLMQSDIDGVRRKRSNYPELASA